MKRTKISIEPDTFPESLRPLLKGGNVYDSSCSREARVWYLDTECGFYLKSAAKGSLAKEAAMTRYFYKKGLGAEVLLYESLESDWLLTARIPGEDGIFPMYLEDPVRLCDLTAQLLRMLHETDFADCPIPNRTSDYLETARRNFQEKRYDIHLFPDNWGYDSPESAWKVVEENGKYLKTDTLLHGDYCLPNIMLNNWQFSGFIDLDTAGVGDRHVDLFWGVWSLQFNLKTDRYRQRFLDAYGREKINEELFPVIAAAEVFG